MSKSIVAAGNEYLAPRLSEGSITIGAELGSGDAKLVPTIGAPIKQVKASQMLNARFRREGINAIAFPLHIPPDALDGFVSLLRTSESFAGASVTIPHKIALLDQLDELTPRARRAGAVNIVARAASGQLTGDMVDGLGFLASLAAAGHDLTGRRILVVGAGGAGRGVIAAIVERNPETVWIADLDEARATDAACSAGRPATAIGLRDIPQYLSATDIVINTTPLGLNEGEPLPFTLDHAPADLLVADILVKPTGTALLKDARARGLRTIDGSGMLALQIGFYLEFLGLAR